MNRTSVWAVLASMLLGPGSVVAADGAATAETTNQCAPTGELRGNADKGKKLHATNCADCHGVDGKAQVIVMHMDVMPKDQSNPAYMPFPALLDCAITYRWSFFPTSIY